MTIELNDTEDYGFTEIEIAKVGEYVGSSADGKTAIAQNFTEESLKKVVEKSEGKEYLLDQMHNSVNPDKRDDRACGWIKALSFENGSIFGKCFWTKLGAELVKSRIFRFISPVFNLNEDGTPDELVNVALTNTPAITDIRPVINSSCKSALPDENIEKDKLIMEITKEELVDLIRETVNSMKVADEQPVEEVKKEEPAEEKAESACPVEEAKNECPVVEAIEEVKEEVKEEAKNEEPVEEKKEAEVIKIEALNSAPVMPTVNSEPAWKNLKGNDFIKFIESGKWR